MPTVPTWQAATSGQQGLAGHVNQLLGSHKATLLYAGTQTAARTTAGTGSASSNALWIAQSFSTASLQTAIGYVIAQISSGGTSLGSNLGPTTLSLYANAGSAPSGSPIVSVTMTAEYVGAAPLWVTFPLPASGLSGATTYWLVLAAAGNSTYSYQWNKSNQTSGASTSPDGVTWTAQSYGLLYQVYDQSATGQPTCSWEDAGARWTWRSYTSSGLLSQYAEYTAGQTLSGYLQSFRGLTYINGLITGVS